MAESPVVVMPVPNLVDEVTRAQALAARIYRSDLYRAAVAPLGISVTLLPSGSLSARAATRPSRAICNPTIPDGAAAGSGWREWFIFRIEPFM